MDCSVTRDSVTVGRSAYRKEMRGDALEWICGLLGKGFGGELNQQYQRLFLHAGFTNLKGIEHEYFTKTFYWDRTLWELAMSLDPGLNENDLHYPKRLTNYKEIYIGHTPVTRMGKTTPQNGANVWNIDTGAAFMGPLTIMDVDTKKYWQSDPVHTFYPDENGRN